MNDKLKLGKLDKVLVFYEQNLELSKLELAQSLSEVKRYQQQQVDQREAMAQLHQRMAQTDFQLTARDSALALASRIEEEIRLTLVQLDSALAKSESLQEEVRSQLSRIKSFEKLIANKRQTIDRETRQREVHAAGDAFLNSKTRGMNR